MSAQRIGDQERDAAVRALGDHFAAGRLTHEEFEERSTKALTARTMDELEVLMVDLPDLASAPVVPFATRLPAQWAGAPREVSKKARNAWFTAGLAPWAIFGAFFIVIWLITGAGYFWPIWPILGWGVGVAVSGVAAFRTPEKYLQEQDEQERHKLKAEDKHRSQLPPGSDPSGQGRGPGR